MRKEIIVDILTIIAFLLMTALFTWVFIDHCSECSALYEFTTTDIDWGVTLRVVLSAIFFAFGIAATFGGAVLMGIFTYNYWKTK